VVNVSIDILTFAIALISMFFVSQQKPSQYPYVKNLLIFVHFFFEGVVLLEIARNFISTAGFLELYTLLATSFIFWDVLLLTVIAYSVYVRPGGRGIVGRLRSLFVRWPHGFIIGTFIVYLAGADYYLGTAHPYKIVDLITIDSVHVLSTAFNTSFLYVSFLTLVFFLAYPTVLLIRETLQVKDPDVRRALVILPFCWVGIGGELLIFNGYLITLGYDLVAIGYAIAALVFGVAATIFRRASLLSSFFEPIPGIAPGMVPVGPKGERGALDAKLPVLMEVNPSTNYETAVKGLAAANVAAGGLVYVFTSKGSPVYNSLSDLSGVRFYILTSRVSYPKTGERETELLVPQNDMAVLLDLLDKTIASTSGSSVSVIFDSVSDLILDLGFESTHKFIKQANEILDKPTISSLYLITAGAHDDRVMSLARSLFRMQAVYDSSGLHVTRAQSGGAAAT
jgi:hypothetical protein